MLYVNAADSVADCPSGFVTITSLAPALPAGVVAVSWELLTKVAFVAATPPIFILAPIWKLLPAIATPVPPVVGPLLGTMEVIVGAGTTGTARQERFPFPSVLSTCPGNPSAGGNLYVTAAVALPACRTVALGLAAL